MSSPTTCGASNATVCLSSDDFGYSFDAETMLGQQHDNLLPFQDATTSTSMVALGVLMLLIRYSRSLVFEPALARLGVRLGEYTHGSAWVAQHTEQMENFRSFSFRLLYRCVVCGLGLYEFYQNPEYWYDTQQLWVGYPHHICSNTVQIVYLLQLAYHLEDLGSVMMEGNYRKRADFTAMVVHHIVTALLLYGSSRLGTQRIGVIVSTLHAVTDVPKDFTQVAKQLEWKWCKRAGFVTLLVTWIVARVVLYPCKYVRSVFTEARESLVYTEGGMSNMSLNIFITLLSTLVLLNGMWCHMLVKLVIRVLREGDSSTDDPMLKKDASTKPKSTSTLGGDDDDLDPEDEDDQEEDTAALSDDTSSESSLDTRSDHQDHD